MKGTRGKPTLVMRNTTERPEGVIAGTLKLVGTRKENIVSAMKELLTNQDVYYQMSETKNPYGDGKASKYILQVLLKKWGNEKC
ncbi:UDP-N-acetylglucosamine 2-epimerase [Helicobacter typhlonius]|uniref:UDP-N-acetylglucosamine 2-epimerase n=1 Tax=Helicobacter typhlonius TaxID=76936 RepID=UPI002FE0B837